MEHVLFEIKSSITNHLRIRPVIPNPKIHVLPYSNVIPTYKITHHIKHHARNKKPLKTTKLICIIITYGL